MNAFKQKTSTTLCKSMVVALSIGGLYACGGGGGTATSSVTSVGVITGFGSIFVNGVEFETDDSTVSLDGDSSTAGQLELGMVVKVSGTVNGDGITGNASSISFNDEVQGPVSSISVGPDGATKTLSIIGSTVHVDEGSTIFDGISFATIAINDVIEVSGYINAKGDLQATRLEKKENFVPGTSEVEMKGVVAATVGTTFTLGGITVDFSAADLSDVPGGVITDGLQVEIKGTLVETTLTATEVEIEDDLFGNDEDEVELENIITNFFSVNDFQVGGQSVDASGATLKPASLALQDGLKVEVEGSIVNGVLLATEVEAREGEIELEAIVQVVDSTAKTITLQFTGGTVTVDVDSLTSFEDELGIVDPLTIAHISIGDYLKIHARDTGGANPLATEIKRDDLGDDEIQGPVDSFVAGASVTILGVTFNTLVGTTAFEDDKDSALTSAEFYAALANDAVVKIEDNQPADGVADEAEFED
jgi:hypothetical protein